MTDQILVDVPFVSVAKVHPVEMSGPTARDGSRALILFLPRVGDAVRVGMSELPDYPFDLLALSLEDAQLLADALLTEVARQLNIRNADLEDNLHG